MKQEENNKMADKCKYINNYIEMDVLHKLKCRILKQD